MESGRFSEIIQYNCSHADEMRENIKNIYSEFGMDNESELLNIMQVVRPLFQDKDYIIVEIPMKDEEIGALCYKKEALGYVFLNSSLPKVNVNFALCHEIYHVFCQKQQMQHSVELYMNEHYYEYEEERAANLFAGMLLMPEHRFKNMFRKFSQEQQAEDTVISLIVKLMNYYEAPYMAVVIRSYELSLLEDGDVLRQLLQAESSDIQKEFERLWLNADILKPTKNDDYKRLAALVEQVGEEYSGDGIVSKRTIQEALKNMQKVYQEIRR